MQQLRMARQEDLHRIAAFITDRFWDLEQHTLLARGLSKPRDILTSSTEASLHFFLAKGDVHVYGSDVLQGVLVGVPARRNTVFSILLSSLKASRLLSGISKADAAAIRENGVLQGKVHDRTWYRRHSRNAYYINWIAVARECRGSGVFRKLITPVIDRCRKEGLDIVLETFTASNVPIYEHFGFELVETHTSPKVDLVEYCLIRRHSAT